MNSNVTPAAPSASVELFFKKVSETAIKKDSRLAEYLDKKRPNLKVSYVPVTIDSVSAESPEQVAFILNQSIEALARRKVAENSHDWNYSPASADLTVSAVFADLTAESARGQRILSAVNLKMFSDFYKDFAMTQLGKNDKAAANGALVIESKFSAIAGRPDVITVFAGNLASADEFLNSDAAGNLDKLDLLIAVSQKLMEVVSGMLEVTDIDIDAI